MASQIELYEEMSALSSRMAEAARAGDWDNLIELERRVATLRDTLMGTPDDPGAARDADRKRLLIRGILEDDAEIRRHTEPWMEHVRRYLGDSVRRRDIERAYAAGAGDTPADRPGA